MPALLWMRRGGRVAGCIAQRGFKGRERCAVRSHKKGRGPRVSAPAISRGGRHHGGRRDNVETAQPLCNLGMRTAGKCCIISQISVCISIHPFM